MVRHAPIHRRSGHSDIAICCGRNVRGSSPSTSVVPLSNQVTTLNHKRFKGFKMFSDGHLESVRKHQEGLQSFRSMRRIEESRRKASALRLRFSQSLANLRMRLSQEKVGSRTTSGCSTTSALHRSEVL